MAHILHIDSSRRGEGSYSRKLSYARSSSQAGAAHPENTLPYRDLGHNSVSHVDCCCL
jgi:FMN-dependent NADH-azoreductase